MIVIQRKLSCVVSVFQLYVTAYKTFTNKKPNTTLIARGMTGDLIFNDIFKHKSYSEQKWPVFLN